MFARRKTFHGLLSSSALGGAALMAIMSGPAMASDCQVISSGGKITCTYNTVGSVGPDAPQNGGTGGDGGAAASFSLGVEGTPQLFDYPTTSQSPVNATAIGGAGAQGSNAPKNGFDTHGGSGGKGGAGGDITVDVGTGVSGESQDQTLGISAFTVYSLGGLGGATSKGNNNASDGPANGYGGNGGTVVVNLDGRFVADDFRSVSISSSGGTGGRGREWAVGFNPQGADAARGGDAGTVTVNLLNAGGASTNGFYGQSGVAIASTGGAGGLGGDGSGADGTQGGQGGDGGNGNAVLVTVGPNVTIVQENDSDAGLSAVSSGGAGGTGGKGGSGGLSGAGGNAQSVTLQFTGGQITAHGTYSPGVLAQSLGGNGGDGGSASTFVIGPQGGPGSKGGTASTVSISGAGLTVVTGDYIDPNNISRSEGAVGVLAQSIGGGGGTGSDAKGVFAVGGDGGIGVNGDNASISLQSNVLTFGFGSNGLAAQSIGGGGGKGGDATGTSIGLQYTLGGTAGGGGDGATAQVSSLAGSVIDTRNAHAAGILVQSVGGGGGQGGAAYSKSISAGFGASIALGGSGGKGGSGGTVGWADGETATNAGRISTAGSDAYGILAQSIGGGGGAGGASTAKSRVIAVEDVSISLTMSVGGNGGQAGDGGQLTVGNAGLISTGGAGAVGMLAQSVGGGGGSGGDASSSSTASGGEFDITANLTFGGSAGTGGHGGNAAASNSGFILTTGESADGMLVQSVGGGGGAGGAGDGQSKSSSGTKISASLVMGGKSGSGGDGYAVTASNIGGTIITLGDGAFGMGAQSVGGGGGRGGGAAGSSSGDYSATVTMGADGGAGGSTYHTDGNGNQTTPVTVTNDATSTIVTFGADATGIIAQSIGGGGGIGGKAGSNIATSKSNGDGGNGGATSAGAVKQAASAFDANGSAALNNFLGLNNAVQFTQSLLGVTSAMRGGLGDDDADGALDDISQSKGETDDDNESSSIQISVALGGAGGSAGSAGAVNVANAGEIATMGHHADAILAQAIGGGGGKGGAASTASSNDYSGNLSVGGNGGGGGNGGQPTVTHSGTIITKGALSAGIVAQSIAGGGGVGGVSASSVKTSSKNSGDDDANDGAFQSISLSVGGDGGSSGDSGQVVVNSSGSISTTAHDSIGILAQSITGGGGIVKTLATDLEGAGGSASTKGTDHDIQFKFGGSNGTTSLGSGLVNVTTQKGGVINTRGDNSHGILAQSIAGGGGLVLGGTAVGTNAAAFFGTGKTEGSVINDGGNNSGLSVTVGDNITTAGNGAIGVLAQSIGGGGGLAGNTSQAGNFVAMSGMSHMSGSGGLINMTLDSGATITTAGLNAPAVFLQSIGGGGGRITNASGAFVGTAGGSGTGGEINATINGSIKVTGGGSAGIFAQSQGDGSSNSPIKITLGAQSLVSVGLNSVPTTPNGGSAGIYIDHGGKDADHANIVTVNGTLATYGSVANSVAIYSSGGYTAVILPQGGTIMGDILLTNNGGQGCLNNAGTWQAGNYSSYGACGVSNSGTIVVGRTNEAATLTIDGNYKGSGKLLFDANFAGSASDRLVVTGTAVVGDTITVNASSMSNRAIKVLTASGGLTLDPAVATADSSHLYDFKVAASGKDLSVTPVANFKVKASGFGANERAVAGSLQSLFDGGASADKAFTRLLSVADDAGYVAGLRSLAGQGLGAFGAFRFNSSRTFAANLYGGCAGLQLEDRDVDRCGWARVLANTTTQDAGTDKLGYKADAWGLQMGGQTPLSDELALTGSLAYESSKFRDGNGSARITGDTLVGGLGLLYTPARLELSAGIDAAYGWYKSRRTITLGLSEEANASPKQSQLGGHLRLAYNLLEDGRGFVRPFAEGHAIHVSNKAFTETGSSPFRLAVEGRSDTAVIGVAGVEFGTELALSEKVSLRPFASAAIEYGSPRDWTTTARFAEQPQGDSFHLRTAGPGTLGKFAIGADLIGARNVAFSIRYAPELGKDFTSHSGTARLTLAF